MYNEYSDLIYEGLISDSFYTDIVEEGIGESIKKGFSRLRTMIKTFINKVIEKWKWLMGKIRQGINKIKDKFRKGNTTNTNINKADTDTQPKGYGTVKYKFKSKEYIKDFDEEYNKVSKYIDDMLNYVKNNMTDSDEMDDAIDDFDDTINDLDFPSNMDDLKNKILDLSENKDRYDIETEEEMNIILNTKPEKYTGIINKLQSVSKFVQNELIGYEDENSALESLATDLFYGDIKIFMTYLINYATLILQQIQSFKNV